MEDRGAKQSTTNQLTQSLGWREAAAPALNAMLAFAMKIRDEKVSSANTVHRRCSRLSPGLERERSVAG